MSYPCIKCTYPFFLYLNCPLLFPNCNLCSDALWCMSLDYMDTVVYYRVGNWSNCPTLLMLGNYVRDRSVCYAIVLFVTYIAPTQLLLLSLLASCLYGGSYFLCRHAYVLITHAAHVSALPELLLCWYSSMPPAFPLCAPAA